MYDRITYHGDHARTFDKDGRQTGVITRKPGVSLREYTSHFIGHAITAAEWAMVRLCSHIGPTTVGIL